jgi:Alcohol dehydrogenase GroES-like domain
LDVGIMSGKFKDMMEHRFPLIPGVDAAGVVEQVGPGVTQFTRGEEVFGLFFKMVQGEGTYAEYVVVPAGGLVARKRRSTDGRASVVHGRGRHDESTRRHRPDPCGQRARMGRDHDDAMRLSGPAAHGLALADECENCMRHRDRGTVMSSTTQSTIRWQTSLEEALRQAHADDTLVLLDFFSPT